jgi:hypothetical protein
MPWVERQREGGVRVPGRQWFRRYERELVCARCRSVMAWVRLGLWSLMHIRDGAGAEVTPLGGGTAIRLAQTRLADAEAADAAGLPQAQDQYRGVAASRRELEYVRRVAGEVVYELSCPSCQARYVRSLPDLTAAVRRADSSRVVLG